MRNRLLAAAFLCGLSSAALAANTGPAPVPLANIGGLGTGVRTALGVATNASGGMTLLNGAATSGHCLQWSASGIQDTGSACSAGSGVTSVGETFTGGLISVAGSPITTSGTFALTVAGTSGGIPYFVSSSTWASSAALAANALVIGGGAGAAPATTTTGTGVLTALGNAVNTSGGVLTTAGATVTGQLNFGPTATLTDASSIAWNVATAQVAKVTLGGNRTMAAPSNLVDGGTYVLRIIQDGTGTRTLAYNSVFKWPGGVTPTLSTAVNAIDIETFVSDGTNLYGVWQGSFQ